VQIKFEKSFQRDLKDIRDKILRQKVKHVIDEVKVATTISSLTALKKLRGYETYYRIRLGDYRIGIEVSDESVIFVRFLHRREVYRFFP